MKEHQETVNIKHQQKSRGAGGLFSDIKKNLIWQVRSTAADTTSITKNTTGEAIGIGQTPDQCGKLRPKFENFLLTAAIDVPIIKYTESK